MKHISLPDKQIGHQNKAKDYWGNYQLGFLPSVGVNPNWFIGVFPNGHLDVSPNAIYLIASNIVFTHVPRHALKKLLVLKQEGFLEQNWAKMERNFYEGMGCRCKNTTFLTPNRVAKNTTWRLESENFRLTTCIFEDARREITLCGLVFARLLGVGARHVQRATRRCRSLPRRRKTGFGLWTLSSPRGREALLEICRFSSRVAGWSKLSMALRATRDVRNKV